MYIRTQLTSQPRTHINNGTIQRPTRPLHDSHHEKNPRLPRNPFQIFPRPIPPHNHISLRAFSPLGPHPPLTHTPRRIPQIHRLLEIMQELLPTPVIPHPHLHPERGASRVPAQVSLGEKDQVGASLGGETGRRG